MSCRCSSRNHNKLFTSVNNEDCKTLCECNIYPSICLSLNIIKLLDYISQISTSVRRCQMPVKVEWVASTSLVATSVCRRAPTSSSPTETRSPPPHNPPPLHLVPLLTVPAHHGNRQTASNQARRISAQCQVGFIADGFNYCTGNRQESG